MRPRRVILSSLFVCLMLGCSTKGIEDESKQWRERAEALQKQLDEMNNTWKQSNQAIVAAADKVDPFALKELLRKNQDLESLLQELRDIQRFRADGYLRAEAGTIYLQVGEFAGKFRVDAELLGQDIKFFDNMIVQPAGAVFLGQNSNLDTGYGDWLKGFCSQHYGNANLMQCAGNLAGAVDEFSHIIHSRFTGLLEESRKTKINWPTVNVSRQTQGTGLRRISLKITPLEKPTVGPWFSRFYLIQQAKNEPPEVLRIIERSDTTEPFAVGQALSPVEIRLDLAPPTH